MQDSPRFGDADQHSEVFAVLAETDDGKPLVMLNLSFAGLLTNVVNPFQTEATFFLDGVPVSRPRLRRIKIVADNGGMHGPIRDMHLQMRMPGGKFGPQTYEAYLLRLEAIIRREGEDVTNQLLQAADEAFEGKPKQWRLTAAGISAAWKIFTDLARVIWPDRFPMGQ